MLENDYVLPYGSVFMARFCIKYHISCIFSKTILGRELKPGVYMPHKKMHTIFCFRLHLLPPLPSYLWIKAILLQQSITLERLGIEAWSFFKALVYMSTMQVYYLQYCITVNFFSKKQYLVSHTVTLYDYCSACY